jgi:benzodiazapine receptor
MDWYNTLNKSPLTPPSIVFRVVWPILYIMMFVSVITLFQSTQKFIYLPAILFILQLSLNLRWPYVFFTQHDIQLSMTIIVTLTISVICTTYMFYQYNPMSGLLLIPYTIWLCFATYLNWYIYTHN